MSKCFSCSLSHLQYYATTRPNNNRKNTLILPPINALWIFKTMPWMYKMKHTVKVECFRGPKNFMDKSIFWFPARSQQFCSGQKALAVAKAAANYLFARLAMQLGRRLGLVTQPPRTPSS